MRELAIWLCGISYFGRAELMRGMLRAGAGRSYRIHLPIYNGVTAAAVGVPANSTLSPDPPPAEGEGRRGGREKQQPPILFYGTSIVNGHVASRPVAVP